MRERECSFYRIHNCVLRIKFVRILSRVFCIFKFSKAKLIFSFNCSTFAILSRYTIERDLINKNLHQIWRSFFFANEASYKKVLFFV